MDNGQTFGVTARDSFYYDTFAIKVCGQELTSAYMDIYILVVILFSLLSGSASFSLCCADEFTKNETACCPQIEY